MIYLATLSVIQPKQILQDFIKGHSLSLKIERLAGKLARRSYGDWTKLVMASQYVTKHCYYTSD
jgi:hypothetical protein